ncbi:AMP-binding protein [Rhodalgimonas zhirmunskyi]|uniref:3-methylmercaptopropionyl-CoA ligase n=1 Tax=Rhodalgimonas zhirmunskyi TaxID=2964767 RepID=A0AAJ1UCM9_9RHOB|nr:AMP-binding protein [Rhodoalgimonas zhirmunskyi]MDQ2095503.1 AMP-binding protein [Rhodoalgimonas zhirmunskyi]
MGWLRDETGLEKNAANHAPLTPLSHLRRGRDLFADRLAVVYGTHRKTYAEYYERVSRLASALCNLGVAPGDVVSTIIPNLPAQVEAHFGVPACGAVLNTINTRLDVATIAYILGHAEAKVVLVDTAHLPLAQEAIAAMDGPAPQIVEVADPQAGYPATGDFPEYEDLLASADAHFDWIMPEDEWESLSINYTSGTTGQPKGVVYHHRGAALNTFGQVVSWRLTLRPVYLTIVPLFHCNGWCHTWMMPLLGGTVVCCRDITAKNIYDAIADEGVTHFGGAPIVLNSIVNAVDADRRPFDHVVEVFTAGAPPPAATLRAIEPLGFNVTQVYGLTETYGPANECMFQPHWEALPDEERYDMKARTGVMMPMIEGNTVMDPDTMAQVPMDAMTQGEIMFRGNGVMKGYLKNPKATQEAFRGGWFHSGDLAIQHPDTYMKILDRSKDIIISGGENVSSVEVEGVLMAHPAISLCAVVAKSDPKWGEVPCAFVEFKPGQSASAEDIITFARSKLAGFKTPKHVIERELPKTSTGKIQKFELRRVAEDI